MTVQFRATAGDQARRPSIVPSHLDPMLLTTLAAAPLLAPAPLPPVAQDGEPRDLLVLWYAGARACLDNPKDKALLEVMDLLPQRLAELPSEVPDFPELPPGVVELAMRLLGGPMSFHLSVDSEPIPGLPVPAYAKFTLPGSAEEGEQLFGTVSQLLSMAGVPAAADAEGRVALPVSVPLWFENAGGDFELSFGKLTDTKVQPSAMGLPDGVEPTFAAAIEYGQLIEEGLAFLSRVQPQAELDELEASAQLLEDLGLYDVSFQITSGTDGDRSYGSLRMPGLGATSQEMGTVSETPLGLADLAIIPDDAIWATVSRSNIAASFELGLAIAEQQLAQAGMAADPLEMFAQLTGVHLMDDIFANLGDRSGMYASDTTGGGGMLSTVLFVEVKDSAALTDAIETICELLNGMVSMQTRGYVEARSFDHAGLDLWSLTFPGVPVPLELTMTIGADHMFVGLSPQAVISAVEQASGGGSGLMGNPRFREQAGSMEGATGVTFTDTPRLMRDGYGFLTLLSAALANGTRSPHDSSRDAGLILPSYNALSDGARASVTIARIEGSDIVYDMRGDASMLVNLAGLAGAVGNSPLVLVGPALVAALTARAVDEPVEFDPVHEHGEF